MDLLKQFDQDARDFFTAWRQLPASEKEALCNTAFYKSAFRHAFTVKHMLQQPLMRGPQHHKTYTHHTLQEHDMHLSDSDDSDADAHASKALESG